MKISSLTIILIALCSGVQQLNAQGLDMFSHKHMMRLEKVSSSVASLAFLGDVFQKNLGYTALSTQLEKLFFVSLAINGIANMALGCGYQKDKRAFTRCIIPALAFASVFLNEAGICSESTCGLLLLIDVTALIAREGSDFYYWAKDIKRL